MHVRVTDGASRDNRISIAEEVTASLDANEAQGNVLPDSIRRFEIKWDKEGELRET